MPRQQTLAASVDWSYERLDDVERIAFRRLGVFAGPFPLEAAEMVVASPGDIDRDEVFDLVQPPRRQEPRRRRRRRRRSTPLSTAGDPACVRHRAGSHAPANSAALRDAHATWWTEWLEPRWAMPSEETLEAADQFHGNLVAALEWSIADPSRGLTLLTRLARVWTQTGRAGDAMVAVDRLLTDDNAERHGPAWLAAATEACALGVPGARESAEAFALARSRRATSPAQHGDDYHAALARVVLARRQTQAEHGVGTGPRP